MNPTYRIRVKNGIPSDLVERVSRIHAEAWLRTRGRGSPEHASTEDRSPDSTVPDRFTSLEMKHGAVSDVSLKRDPSDDVATGGTER